MKTLKVIGAKLTEDIESTKFVYELPDGRMYIRNGTDGFKTGIMVDCGETTLFSKWGFRKVVNPPEFRDGTEMYENVKKFQLKVDGMVQYYN